MRVTCVFCLREGVSGLNRCTGFLLPSVKRKFSTKGVWSLNEEVAVSRSFVVVLLRV